MSSSQMNDWKSKLTTFYRIEFVIWISISFSFIIFFRSFFCCFFYFISLNHFFISVKSIRLSLLLIFAQYHSTSFFIRIIQNFFSLCFHLRLSIRRRWTRFWLNQIIKKFVKKSILFFVASRIFSYYSAARMLQFVKKRFLCLLLISWWKTFRFERISIWCIFFAIDFRRCTRFIKLIK